MAEAKERYFQSISSRSGDFHLPSLPIGGAHGDRSMTQNRSTARSNTPVRAIRAKCLVCAGGKKSIRTCESESCPLYLYRMGRNPSRSGIGGRPPCRNARSCQKSPSQVRVSADKNAPQGSTPETILGHPRAFRVQVDGPRTSAEIMASEILRGLAGGWK